MQARGRATDIMERQLGQLVRLVDDLLDVSRINTEKFAIRMGRVELRAVVNDAPKVVRPFIKLHGHALAIDLPDRPVFLRGDPARLAQILSNLLNNAARYTQRGGHVGYDLARAMRRLPFGKVTLLVAVIGWG